MLRNAGVLIDFNTVVNPVDFALALLLYIPQYGKVSIPQHHRNLYLTRLFSPQGQRIRADIIHLDDFTTWQRLIGNFNRDKNSILPNNIAASIELLRLGLKSGLVEFLEIPADFDLYTTKAKLEKNGILKPLVLEMVNLDIERTGLNTLSPQWGDIGLTVILSLCRTNNYAFSSANPLLAEKDLSTIKRLGLQVVTRSNPISEIFQRKRFPNSPYDVFEVLQKYSLFEQIASCIIELEREKRARSDLIWFFPKLLINSATGSISSIVEFFYLVSDYIKKRQNSTN